MNATRVPVALHADYVEALTGQTIMVDRRYVNGVAEVGDTIGLTTLDDVTFPARVHAVSVDRVTVEVIP